MDKIRGQQVREELAIEAIEEYTKQRYVGWDICLEWKTQLRLRETKLQRKMQRG